MVPDALLWRTSGGKLCFDLEHRVFPCWTGAAKVTASLLETLAGVCSVAREVSRRTQVDPRVHAWLQSRTVLEFWSKSLEMTRARF